jgi:glycosyltransferase involved in cell wall biosynthesis
VFAFYKTEKNFVFTTLSIPDFLHFGSVGFLMSAIWFAERVRWLKSFREADVICSRDALVLVQYLLLGRKILFEPHLRPTFVSTIVARRAYHVVTISQGLKDAYVARGVPSEHISVAPAGVDEHLFDTVPAQHEARAELGLSPAAHIVLYAGHLYPRKGADTLAEAAALIPEATFVFVGGAPDDIVTFKKRWGEGANIRIIGQVPHEKIPFYLRAADVLVIPNSGKDEDSAHFTSPLKLFEYMASGTPIVTSDVPSVREILPDDAASFVSADDAAALAAGIRATLADKALAEKRAQRACKVVGTYSWAARGRSILTAMNAPYAR